MRNPRLETKTTNKLSISQRTKQQILRLLLEKKNETIVMKPVCVCACARNIKQPNTKDTDITTTKIDDLCVSQH